MVYFRNLTSKIILCSEMVGDFLRFTIDSIYCEVLD